jgi:hypothetical protein
MGLPCQTVKRAVGPVTGPGYPDTPRAIWRAGRGWTRPTGQSPCYA